MKTYQFTKSIELFDRATRTIPAGIYGHESPAITVPGSFPYYAVRAEGCRYWDVDGNEFIDYMCAYGPMVIGHNHPKVEEAVRKQQALGNCLNHPAPVMIELAEYMVDLVGMADWAVFAKNGSDMTTWAVQVAREFTGRPGIVRIKGAYHGTHAWCTPGHGGLIAEDRTHVHAVEWNDLEGLSALAAEQRGEIAGLIATPYHHPAFGDSVLPAEGYWKGVEALCREEGIVLIVDDVRAGFRLDLKGSHAYFGFEPDLVTFCKAIGNGYPISASVGREALKNAASKVFLTGSYWNSAVPMVAALATLEELKASGGVETMHAMGTMLMEGLTERAEAHGLQVRCSGPPAIPFVRFANETNFMRQQVFCAEATKRGAFLHPHHNWFMSAAHTADDIQQTLDIADEAYKIVKEQFGG